MPPMLRAIVDDLLARESDLLVTGSSRTGEDPLVRAREERADMLITQDGGESGESGETCLEAILSGPPLSVLAIAADGREAAAVSLVRQPVDIEGDTNATFADAIRRVAWRQ
jgi:DNA-binding NarL/FixJ family response regulator